jgi:Ricin-type beta-trefoil lectin domain-like/Domain of unknown function (DUF1793)
VVDWELWTAAWFAEQTDAVSELVTGVYGFLNDTANRVPFSDLYVVGSAAQVAFQNRPVVGGMYGLMLPPAKSAQAWYTIKNRQSGLVLTVPGNSLADGADITQAAARDGTPEQLWTVLPNGDGTVRLANRNGGKVLAVDGQSTAAGADAQQYQDNGTADHNWTLTGVSGKWVEVLNQNSGLVLAVADDSSATGGQVVQAGYDGASDQLWELVAQ